MPKKSPRPARRQRRHGDLPAGFKWRDGRPRWEPSPARRAQGWKGQDLKDAAGRWLARGAAIEKAQAIAVAARGWAAGAAVPFAVAAIAPKGALEAGATAADLSPRSIGTLLDAYFADALRFGRLGARTQADYRAKLGRFLETVTGSAEKTKIDRLRALPIDEFQPPAFGEPGEFELQRAYDALRQDAGEHMAHGVMACVSAWLTWCVKRRRVWPTNPAALLERATPDGRIEVFEWDELVALVRAADTAGLASIADAVILGIDLSWSQQDLLALTWGQISDDGHVRHRRIKTGVAGNPPLLAIGKARLALIRARLGANVTPAPGAPLIVCELPDVPAGRAWAADTFRHKFSEIRAAAAKQVPSLATKQFRDLRDTAVTYCIDAGMEQIEEICSRTLHTPLRAQAVISKHYGSIRQGVADRAARRLDQHFARMGYTFDEPLALPPPAQGGEG